MARKKRYEDPQVDLSPVDRRRVRKLHREIKIWRRLRWFLTLMSLLGLGVSGALLVVHAPDNIWAQVIGAWPPVAVFGIIEILARVPITSKVMGVGRIIASLSVAGAGLYLSYFQQIDLMEDVGYDQSKAWAFPWTIDGFMIVSTLSMVEVARRIRALLERIDAIEDPEPVLVAVAPAVVAATPVVVAETTVPTVVVDAVIEPVTPVVAEELEQAEPELDAEPVNDDQPVAAGPRRRRPARTTVSDGVKRPAAPVFIDAVVETAEVPVG